MLFLAWLAVSFLTVAVINLYLRHFGLPRRQVSSGSTTDGRVSSTSSGLSQYYSGTTAVSTSTGQVTGVVHGESAKWINSILTWIYQRTPSGGQRIELMDAWLKSLTEQAENQSREMRVKFDDVRGSLPELSNFSVDPSSAVSGITGVPSSGLNVHLTVTAKDITLQTCVHTATVDSTRTIYADVYLLQLQGRLKVAVSPSSTDGEMAIHVSFVSTPELRLQIVPSGRLDASIDLSSVEKMVRAALCGAVARVTWSSTGIRSYQPSPSKTQLQSRTSATVTPGIQRDAYGVTTQQSFSGIQSASDNLQQQQQPQQQQQQQQQYANQQFIQPQQQQMQFAAMSPTSLKPGDMTTRTADISLQDSFNNRTGQKLLVKVIKANGLADDLGSCNAYCVIRLDRPSQNYMTAVARNTVNPIWDEQFVFDFDSFTKQIQFDVLDRDKQPDNELLGKAIVQLDEVRRMPSSRQILPLTGRLRSRTATSGSVTVEFALLDATDATNLPVNDNMNAVRVTSQQAMQSIPPNTTSTSYNDPVRKPDTASGDYGTYQNRLSAHDLALSQQGGNRQQESPTLIVTGTELHRPNIHGTLDGRSRGHEPKESFASALKKRLTRGGGKKRSQSADRAQPHSQSLHEGGSYLRPPGDTVQGYRTTDMTVDSAAERKARSNSFTSSLRRIFKPSQSGAGGKKDLSREGSLTKNPPSDISQSQQGYNYDRSVRQSTPVPPGADRRVTGNTTNAVRY